MAVVFARPGTPLEQNVPARQYSNKQAVNHDPLPVDDLPQFRIQLVNQIRFARDLFFNLVDIHLHVVRPCYTYPIPTQSRKLANPADRRG